MSLTLAVMMRVDLRVRGGGRKWSSSSSRCEMVPFLTGKHQSYSKELIFSNQSHRDPLFQMKSGTKLVGLPGHRPQVEQGLGLESSPWASSAPVPTQIFDLWLSHATVQLL